MADYGCKDAIPFEELDETLIPSDVSVFPYIILDICCDTADELVMLTTLSGLQPGESVEVTISGGCPPYKWEAELPLSFTSFYTTTTSNTLYLDINATAQNNVSSFSISDTCYDQGSTTVSEITGEAAIVTQSGTGDPWALIFYAPTADCFLDDTVNSISLAPTWPITSVNSLSTGVTVAGLNPVSMTVPAGKTTFCSLSVDMYAAGYHWANGDAVYGNAVTIVWYCDCSVESASIIYTTQQMSSGSTQTLGIDGDWNACYSWSLSGGGSLGTPAANGDVVLTAPTSNPECANNMVVSLSSGGVVIDTLDIATDMLGSITTWYVIRGTCYAASPTWVRCTVSSMYCNSGRNWGAGNYMIFSSMAACLAAGCGAVGNIMDNRSPAQITAGCCPYQLM